MEIGYHPRMRAWMDMIDLLEAQLAEHQRNARKRAARNRRPTRGLVLKPGNDTPLWNALSLQVNARLLRRGDKAKLARFLGLPRQRVHQLFVERSAVPDAERTLLSLAWLHARLKNPRFA
jgi:hypothetical protein